MMDALLQASAQLLAGAGLGFIFQRVTAQIIRATMLSQLLLIQVTRPPTSISQTQFLVSFFIKTY